MMNDHPSNDEPGPYHSGELAVQRRAGVRAMAARAGNAYRNHLPDVASAFLAEQPWVFVGGADRAGRVWASVWTGEPGFARGAVDRVTLAASPDAHDPLGEAVRIGQDIGLLAIDLARRKRLRVNGTVVSLKPVTIGTEQVYANCPKFIQGRSIVPLPPRRARSEGVEKRDHLDRETRAMIARADTFFIASGVPRRGFDVSHRGGQPGFVEVGSKRLTWGDYAGNTMFNTLGNLASEPRAGLLFIDFTRGDVIQVSGEATIDWNSERVSRRPGAERLVSFTVERVLVRSRVLDIAFGPAQPSPFNP